jgi:RNA polymerase sigma-70 factor (ECF subfamily)
MLRVPDADAIRNPEAYLFTVAANLLREHYLSERRHVHHLNVDDLDVQEALTPMITPMDRDIDTQARLSMLGEVLQQLSPKCRAALMLQFHHGLSYREIGERLGVSTNMVKKYLAQGLSHCRKRMARLG